MLEEKLESIDEVAYLKMGPNGEILMDLKDLEKGI